MDNIFGLNKLGVVIFAMIVIIVVLIIIYWSNKDNNYKENMAPKYYRKKFFFSPKEYEFMNILKRLLEEKYPWKYYIFPKTRLADIFEASRYSNHHQWDTNKIWAKHVDFLIVDLHNAYNPVLAIELNGTSHDNEEYHKRDSFVSKMFLDNKINFLIIRNEEVDNQEAVVSKIMENLK